MKFCRRLLTLLVLPIIFIGSLKAQTLSDSILYSGIETSLIEISRLNLIGQSDSLLNFIHRVDSVYPENSTVKYEYSTYYLNRGDFNKSLFYALKADSLNKTNEYYKLRLADIYSAFKDYSSCAEIYSELIKLSPYNEEYYNTAIQYYAIIKDYKEALLIVDKFEEVFGYNDNLSAVRYDLISRISETDSAYAADKKIEFAKNLYNRNSKNPTNAIYLSLIYKELGLEKESSKVIKKFEKKNGKNGIINLFKASEYLSNGDYDNFYKYSVLGIGDKNSSIDDRVNYLSDFVDAFYQIKSDSIRELYGDKLVELLKEARYIENENLTISILYSELLNTHSKDQAKYIEELKHILSFDTSNDYVFENIVFHYLTENRLDSALYYSDLALKNFPDKGIFYYAFIYDALSNEDYAKAVELSEIAINYVNKFSNLHLTLLEILGESYYNIGEVDKAFETFDYLLKFDPNNILILNNYAYYLCVNDKRLSDAKKMSYKTIYAEPNNPVYLDTYAWILYKLGEYDNAELYMKKAIDNTDKDNDIITYYEHYSEILKANGKLDLSEEYKNRETELKSKVNE